MTILIYIILFYNFPINVLKIVSTVSVLLLGAINIFNIDSTIYLLL